MHMAEPALLTIEQAIQWGQKQLAGGESATLDCRLLLCHVLSCSAAYLFTWPEKSLTSNEQQEFKTLIASRKEGHPVAYLIGERQFWSLSLAVNDSTLIPRPETELLVDIALNTVLAEPQQVLDLGTGTGAVALAIASERPNWQVTGVDRIEEAVALAEHNASKNNLTNVTFLVSHWFSALSGLSFNLIVSNPPYVESNSHYLHQGDVRFEPASALTAGPDGLDDIREIIDKAPHYLVAKGYLMLEHGYEQSAAIRQLLDERGFSDCQTFLDLNGIDRITIGRWLA